MLGTAGVTAPVLAEDRDGGNSNVIVLPVKTDLQRTVFGIDKNTKACVLVNSDGLRRDDDALHWSSLDFEALAKALAPYKESPSKASPSKMGNEPAVVFHVYHEPRPDDDQRFRKLLRWTLVGFGQEQGFRRARWVETPGFPGPSASPPSNARRRERPMPTSRRRATSWSRSTPFAPCSAGIFS